MTNLRKKIDAELENIEEVLAQIPHLKKLPYLETIELAGTATFLHNFYNGIENILSQILKARNIKIPQSPSWHKDLLVEVHKQNVISEKLKGNLINYLAFRHFFVHAYAFDLYPEKMEPLVEAVETVYQQFKLEIKNLK